MSSKSKLAVITAASIGMVLTQSSASRAETENSSAPEKVTRIAAPIDVDEEVLYSAQCIWPASYSHAAVTATNLNNRLRHRPSAE
jgi:hypothetical protein